MEHLKYSFSGHQPPPGLKRQALVGVVASGNLEVLLERCLAEDRCVIEVATPITGFSEVWRAVVEDFLARWPAGGLLISINDGGARPDTVSLRLAQGVRALESA